MKEFFKRIKSNIDRILVSIGAIFIILLAVSIIRDRNQELTNYDAPREETNLIKLDNEISKNVYTVYTPYEEIYNLEHIEEIQEQYEALKDNLKYNLKNPLLIYDLYGTNKLGLNIYFKSDKKSYLEYTITVDDEKISDFTQVLKNDKKNNLTKKHEYQIIGFVPGYINTLKLELKDKNNKVIETKKLVLDLTKIETRSQTFADIEKGKSKEKLANGLYTVLGNETSYQPYTAMYDNDGVLRYEMPIINSRAFDILFKGGYAYFAISNSQMVKMSRLGKIEEIYEFGDYLIHHDYAFNDEGNLLILGTSLKKYVEEDVIIKLNLKTKKVTEVIDFENMFKSYVKTCKKSITSQIDNKTEAMDWLHLNSIDYVDGDVYLSSRETSSILKVSNIETDPKLEYILSDEELWEDTEFEDYVYDQEGDFKIHAGQHSVKYIPGSKEGVYYLELFDNNYGNATSQPDFDYSKIGIKNKKPFKGDASYYYIYEVNEKEKTFKLVDSIEIDYSGIVSSVQTLENGNVLTCSGTAGVFAEYDSENKQIRKFSLKLNSVFIYRVLKYDYKGFWFN